MSKENPGVIFDASNSWNGYNHQGKLAILFAIKQIIDVYDITLTKEKNKMELDKYFIEVEYLEDFSIGKNICGKDEYYYVHQVKNHAAHNASDYDSALLGLAYHVKSMPTLKKAYLHATVDIDFKEKTIGEYLKELVKTPTELINTLSRIAEVRSDEVKKGKLYEKRKGRPENFLSRLKKALIELDENQKELSAVNIDMALDELEREIKKQIAEISSLTEEELKKIELYTYDLKGVSSKFCEVNQIKRFIEEEIKKSISRLALNALWLSDKYVENRYLYLLGELDQHIVDRDLNYPLYKNGKKDRKIKLSKIFEWLTDERIETADDSFYQYHLKEMFSSYANELCIKCKKEKVISVMNA